MTLKTNEEFSTNEDDDLGCPNIPFHLLLRRSSQVF